MNKRETVTLILQLLLFLVLASIGVFWRLIELKHYLGATQ